MSFERLETIDNGDPTESVTRLLLGGKDPSAVVTNYLSNIDYVVIEGEGFMTFPEQNTDKPIEPVDLHPGSTVLVPCGRTHKISGNLMLEETCIPPYDKRWERTY